jgi:hypothetical protein
MGGFRAAHFICFPSGLIAEIPRARGAFRKRNYKYGPQEARLDFMGGLGCALFSRY